MPTLGIGTYALILRDFHCSYCEHQFEALVASKAEREACVACGKLADRTLSVPHIAVIGSDPVRQSDALKKRSFAHSVSEAKKNPDKLAGAYGGKPKSQTKWNIRSHGSKSST